MPLFQPGDAPSRSYCLFRDGQEDHHRRGRDYIERLWRECADLVDADAADKARHDFESVYWELQVAYALKAAGKSVTPRSKLKYQKNEGPDFFVEDASTWVECVVVRAGTGADAIRHPELGKVWSAEPDPLILRFRSVIEDKGKKFQKYIEKGIVRPRDRTVIAISGVLLPYRFSPRIPPEIVRAVYAVSDITIEIHRETREVIDSYLPYRDRVRKASGAVVETNIFLTDKFSHISALLYGEGDWVNPVNPPGHEFKIMHNPRAESTLPDGWFPHGHEYWLRDELRLESKRHNAGDA